MHKVLKFLIENYFWCLTDRQYVQRERLDWERAKMKKKSKN